MTFDEMTQKLAAAAAAEPGNAKSLKLDMGDAGVIRIAGAVVDNQDIPSDCTVRVSKDDFEKIVQGDLDPTFAFMSGKLRVDGDIGVAMGLQAVVGRAFG
ncbi:sterol-binding protein [Brevundimonas sp. Leaf363]|uniref:SCP2 sterol-binding domain-containing protein n=1 Tax=Brevundimonas sp. Leaf363 TaxID=1736353 RepID=UPI0006F4DFB5|nr:SCP2 sterol-binding domain-containing protein [Brevundimonas sp. Leaf363]KQS54234.1 sterol-binding protein [Brevundimonas sp. Leaf363]